MNSKNILILCLVVFSWSTNASGQVASTECNNGSNMEMANCLDGKLTGIQNELKTLLAQMRGSLVYPEEELSAQDLWSQYVEKECASRVSVTGWGAAMQLNTCLIKFTKQRIEDLNTYHFCEDNGCPATK